MRFPILGLLLLISAAIIVGLRFSGRIQPREMTPLGKTALWGAAFVISFVPLSIATLKLLRLNWGFDPSPLTIALYLLALIIPGLIAALLARWVSES